ncbi:hypothetical protein KAR10_02905, partial [bacterium]|nr:hypothetical protein [bacterium]
NFIKKVKGEKGGRALGPEGIKAKETLESAGSTEPVVEAKHLKVVAYLLETDEKKPEFFIGLEKSPAEDEELLQMIFKNIQSGDTDISEIMKSEFVNNNEKNKPEIETYLEALVMENIESWKAYQEYAWDEEKSGEIPVTDGNKIISLVKAEIEIEKRDETKAAMAILSDDDFITAMIKAGLYHQYKSDLSTKEKPRLFSALKWGVPDKFEGGDITMNQFPERWEWIFIRATAKGVKQPEVKDAPAAASKTGPRSMKSRPTVAMSQAETDFPITENDIPDLIMEIRRRDKIGELREKYESEMEKLLSPEYIKKYLRQGLNKEVIKATAADEKTQIQLQIMDGVKSDIFKYIKIFEVAWELMMAAQHLRKIKRIQAAKTEVAGSIISEDLEKNAINLRTSEVREAVKKAGKRKAEYADIAKHILAMENDEIINLIPAQAGNIIKIMNDDAMTRLFLKFSDKSKYQLYDDWIKIVKTTQEFMEEVLRTVNEIAESRFGQETGRLKKLQHVVLGGRPINESDAAELMRLREAYPELKIEIGKITVATGSETELKTSEPGAGDFWEGIVQGAKEGVKIVSDLPEAIRHGQVIIGIEREWKENTEVISIIKKVHGSVEYVGKVLYGRSREGAIADFQTRFREFKQRLSVIYAADPEFEKEMKAELQFTEDVKAAMRAVAGFEDLAVNYYNEKLNPAGSRSVNTKTWAARWAFIEKSEGKFARQVKTEKNEFENLWDALENSSGQANLAYALMATKGMSSKREADPAMIGKFR